jgi:hypothetical protein
VTGVIYQAAEFKEKSYVGQKHQGRILGALNDEKRSNIQDRSPVTKLIKILVVREMVERLDRIERGELKSQDRGENQVQNKDGDGMNDAVITLVDPGLCMSEFTRDLSGFAVCVDKVMSFSREEHGGRVTNPGARRCGGQRMSRAVHERWC